MDDRTVVEELQRFENDLLAALAAELLSEQRKPGDILVTDLARVTGLKVDLCRQKLDAEVKAGRLQKRRIIDNGARCYAYFAT